MKKLCFLLVLLLILTGCGQKQATVNTTVESKMVTFDIYAINVLHGKFADSSTQPGVDELTTYLKNARETDDNVILLSSGDMWQGSSESNLTRGRIITEWMNELDFVSMTLGNHEFDWGEETIRENAALAEFPFLALNVFSRDTGKLADYCTPSVLLECGGVQVGVIGAVGDCYSSCLLYTSPSPRDRSVSRMPSSA